MKTIEEIVAHIIKLADEKTAGYEMKIENTLTQYHQDIMSEVVEKERSRFENEFGDFAHEHYRGCVREADSTYTYGYDNEVIWLVREFFEKQALTKAQDIIKSLSK